MANTSLLAGEAACPDKATEENAQYPGEDRGDYRGQETGTHSDFLATGLRQLDGLIWDSLYVDMSKSNRPSCTSSVSLSIKSEKALSLNRRQPRLCSSLIT